MEDAVAFGRRPHNGEFEKGPIEHGPIIAGEINEPGLYDETAEFDQMFGSFPPIHDPDSCVMSRAPGFEPVFRRYGSPERFAYRCEAFPQTVGLFPENSCASSS
jgi:hypothetical protein